MKRPTLSSTDVKRVDDLIRGGKTRSAREEIRKLRQFKIPRPELRPFANLARRAGLPSISVALLQPVIRPEKPLTLPATIEERGEYAIDLIQIGAVAEGLSLLDTIDPASLADVLLFRSLGLVTQWNYAETIPLLERYIHLSVPPYQRLVGKANLAAALVYTGQRNQARELLGELTEECLASQALRLLGSCVMMEAQLTIDEGRSAEAESHLARVRALSDDPGIVDELLIRKWNAVAEFLARPDTSGAASLERVAREARERGHWETVRDCDYYRATRLKDVRLLAHLYHGTPYDSYRLRLKRDAGAFDVPEHYLWLLTGDGAERVFNIEEGVELETQERLKPGYLLHSLLRLLVSDFYRPIRTVTLFSKLFPGECFSPVSSLHRVHELVNRLRGWLEEADLPLLIRQDAGNYRLQSSRPYGIRTNLLSGPPSKSDALLNAIRRQFGETSFAPKDVAQVLELSKRSASRFLSAASSEKHLVRSGAGSSTRYRIAA